MKKAIRILISAMVVVSCRAEMKKPDAPKDVIPQTEMVSLTKDLMLIESNIEISYGQFNQFYKILNASSESIFKEHKISRRRYTRSFEYYASDQDKMTSLYQEILDSLNIENL